MDMSETAIRETRTNTTVWLVRDDEGRVMDVYDTEVDAAAAIAETANAKERGQYSIQGRRVKTYTPRG